MPEVEGMLQLIRERDFEVDAEEEVDAAAAGDSVVSIDSGREQRADAQTPELLERSRRLLDKIHPDDREEAIGLHEDINTAVESGDRETLRRASEALKELLFFIEGQPSN